VRDSLVVSSPDSQYGNTGFDSRQSSTCSGFTKPAILPDSANWNHCSDQCNVKRRLLGLIRPLIAARLGLTTLFLQLGIMMRLRYAPYDVLKIPLRLRITARLGYFSECRLAMRNGDMAIMACTE